MKTLALILGLTLTVSLTIPLAAAEKSTRSKRKLHHVVAFKFKREATREQIKQIEDSFRDLKKKIKEIKEYQWGTNISPEKHDKGFTHGFILTFNTEKDRDVYLEHPGHKAFGKIVGPVLADVFVIDFWAQN